MDYSLDQLRVLDAIDTTGSFGGAAKALHRVPSAVSYAVRNLEEAVGVPLFDRSTRTPEWTPAGRRMLAQARQVLRQGQDLERAAQELRDGWEPELRVVVDGALPLDPVLACLRHFSRADVPTRLRLDIEYREGVVARFRAEQAHLMLVIGFDEGEDTTGWALSPLPALTLVHCVAPEVADPGGLPSLAVRDSRPGGLAALGDDHVIHLSDFHSKRIAILQGVGTGWMPQHLVADDLEAGRLCMLPAASGADSFTYQPRLVQRADAPTGRATALFLAQLEVNIRKNRR